MKKGKESKLTPLALATMFHENYEFLAPTLGYETREDTKVFDPESPNGKLMVQVCGIIIAQLKSYNL